MDLIIRRASRAHSRDPVDIAIENGRIAAVEPIWPRSAREEIDADGDLVTPPFVDAHFHMDATLPTACRASTQSGTLLEGIALWGELKPS